MRKLKSGLTGLAPLLLIQNNAWAGSAAPGNTNGLLLAIFVGFCTLLVAVQLLPTLLLMVGTVKGFLGKSTARNLGQNI